MAGPAVGNQVSKAKPVGEAAGAASPACHTIRPIPARAMELALAITKPCERLFENGQQLLSSSFDNRARLRRRINLTRLCFLISGPAIGIRLGFRVAQAGCTGGSGGRRRLRNARGDLQT